MLLRHVWYLIVLVLIKRGKTAKIKYFEDGKERFEHVVVATLLPTAKLRRY